jgi:hypothetical protein
MLAKTFPQACIDIIYPAYEALYDVKQNDKNQLLINKVLLAIGDIQKERMHLDVFACELLETCSRSYLRLAHVDKIQRKELDTITNDIMYRLVDLLRSNNKDQSFGLIANKTGKFSDHYTSKNLSFTK